MAGSTAGCGAKAWRNFAHGIFSDIFPDEPPDRVCIAAHDHVLRGLPHKWVEHDAVCWFDKLDEEHE